MTAAYKVSATLANGSATVTAPAAAFTANVYPGAMVSRDGYSVPVKNVDSATQLTLEYAWPGTTGSADTWVTRLDPQQYSFADINRKYSIALEAMARGHVMTSATSVAIGTGSKTFTVEQTGLQLLPGARMLAASRANVANAMWGTVTSYSGSTLVLNVETVSGSGTLADWNINIAGTPGLTGPQGATGAPGELTRSGAVTAGHAVVWTSNTQVQSAGYAPRELLTANRTYYVRTDGSDSNNGLTNNSGGAWLTLQKAMDHVAANLDCGPYIVTVNVADGTYTAGLILKSYARTSGYVQFIGNTTTPGNCHISLSSGPPIYSGPGAVGFFVISGFKLTTSGGSAIGLLIQNPGVDVQVTSLDFGACALYHCVVSENARLRLTGTNYVSGNSIVGFWVQREGLLIMSGSTLNYTSAVAYSARNFNSTEQGFFTCQSMTFAGSAASVTGKRYEVDGLGSIFTAGGGASYIPGSSAGTTTNGGVYY